MPEYRQNKVPNVCAHQVQEWNLFVYFIRLIGHFHSEFENRTVNWVIPIGTLVFVKMALSIGKGNSFSDLLKDGYKHFQGVDETTNQNIQACKDISQMTRTSMGPNGRNKIVLNQLEKMFLTKDTNTILEEMEVVHPAAKLMILAARHQQAEFGDGTGFVLAFSGELLAAAEDLLQTGLKPADIVAGYEEALKITLDELPKFICDPLVDWKNERELEKILYSVISTKQYGLESVLVPLIVKACVTGMAAGPRSFSPECVRVVKIAGGSVSDSVLMNGMILEREPETSKVRSVSNAKVAVFSCPIDLATTETKGTVLIRNAQEMLSFSKDEESSCERTMQQLHESGVRILVTNGTVGDLMVHFANRLGIAITKVATKFDLKRLCRSIGATPCQRFGPVEEHELGFCERMEVVEIGGSRCTLFHAPQGRTISLVIRGATGNKLDDVERTIDAGLAVISAAIRCSHEKVGLMPGAGAVEMQLARTVREYAKGITGVQQYAIEKFGQAFQVIPRILAENSGLDLTQTMGKLVAVHDELSSENAQFNNCCIGIDVEIDNVKGGLLNAKEQGIFDLFHAKKSAIQLAAEAALTILRVDQIIMSRMAGGPKPRSGKQDDDD